MLRGLVLMCVWTVSSGCAITTAYVDLPFVSVNESGHGPALELGEVRDAREHTARIGMKKNGYAMDTADVVLGDKNLAGWLRKRLAFELRNAGLGVSEADEMRGARPVVNVDLEFLFIEPVVQWWTIDFEADTGMRVVVDLPDGRQLQRSYYEKAVHKKSIGGDRSYQVAFDACMDRIMTRIAQDLTDLLTETSAKREQG